MCENMSVWLCCVLLCYVMLCYVVCDATVQDSDNLSVRLGTARNVPQNTDKEFWTIFYNIFNIIYEWSAKKICTGFCFELMIKMICCGNSSFYFHAMKYSPRTKSGHGLPSIDSSNHLNLPQGSTNHFIEPPSLPQSTADSPILNGLARNLARDDLRTGTLKLILQLFKFSYICVYICVHMCIYCVF